GAETVIIQELSTELHASHLSKVLLETPNGIEKVAINFRTRQQQWLDAISVAEAQTLLREGQFGVGSMQPKVEAIVDFINASQKQGKQASGLITSPQTIKAALAHQSGTWITL
ncbi:carbamate kinase, partial [Escherichia coli]|nr:carbamate kinase [Escherichia coli]